MGYVPRVIWRLASALFAALCLAAAAVQYNDPDPALWIVLYTVCAGVSGLAAAGVRRAWWGAAPLALLGWVAFA